MIERPLRVKSNAIGSMETLRQHLTVTIDLVGSLTDVQHSIIIGSLLGDGAMRCKVNALLEINHCFAQLTLPHRVPRL
jgi:hypothetical protein